MAVAVIWTGVAAGWSIRCRSEIRAYLAPDLTDEILNATQPRQLMLKHIRQLDIPLDWQAQRRLFAQFRG